MKWNKCMTNCSTCVNHSRNQNNKITSWWRYTPSWKINTINNLLISKSYCYSYRARTWKLNSCSTSVTIKQSIMSNSCRRSSAMLTMSRRRGRIISNSKRMRDRKIGNRASRNRRISYVQWKAKNHLIMQQKRIKK